MPAHRLRLPRLTLLLLLCPAVEIPAFGQILPMEGLRGYAIYGLAFLPDGSPAPRCVVRLTGPWGLDRQVYTDPNGRYEFRDISGGRYTLNATNLDDDTLVLAPVSVDTSQAASNKIQFNIYFRHRPDLTREVSPAAVVSAKAVVRKVPKQALKAFEQGQKTGTQGKLDRAEESFTRAIELFPEYVEALTERGSIRVTTGRMQEARADFDRAVELDPGYGPALRGAGICLFQEGKYEESADLLEKAVAAEPTVAKDFLFLGMARLSMDHRRQARAAFERALSLDPTGSVRAYVHLANLAIRDNNAVEAISALETYLKAVPNAPDADRLRSILARLKNP